MWVPCYDFIDSSISGGGARVRVCRELELLQEEILIMLSVRNTRPREVKVVGKMSRRNLRL